MTKEYIIRDHMVSHYRKLYSAKAAVDTTVPKTMCCSVKYLDQKRRERLKKAMSERAQSADSLSQRSTRVITQPSSSCKTSRPSVHANESTYLDLRSTVMSSPRLNTSFHSKQMVYPSQTAESFRSPPSHFRSASELSYRSPNSQRHQSAHSYTVSGSQRYKTFKDPIQKTYSGDLLLKHSHCFTQEKPFTPRTLKSNSTSTLSQYRFYTPPRRKPSEEKPPPRLTRQETYHGRYCANTGKEFSMEQEWSDDDSDTFRRHSKENKRKDRHFALSSSRVSPEGMRSPIMKKVTAEEEELMYLEFTVDVTNEILSRGLYSDRVLERVFERHIDMNKHRLDEDKMRHFLELLKNDLQSPDCTSFSDSDKESRMLVGQIPRMLGQQDMALHIGDNSTFTENEDHLLVGHIPRTLGSQEVTKDDSSFLNYSVFNEDPERTENVSSVNTQVDTSLTENTAPSGQCEETGDVELNHKEDEGSSLSENNHPANDENNLQNTSDNHEVIRELDELGKSLAESLHVTETENSQTITEQEESGAKLSDDEF
ncbi:spermatogenesis-associated protein 7 [Chanos chanos]|uniref:Spermatogenesis-associated protein 7 n=1 Tax=Chanos chanos TaxID=29144 RepID=A0A6J2WNR0_CHACN|nr:spermatogenesis-associated protein 7 [Chanos chanos]